MHSRLNLFYIVHSTISLAFSLLGLLPLSLVLNNPINALLFPWLINIYNDRDLSVTFCLRFEIHHLPCSFLFPRQFQVCNFVLHLNHTSIAELTEIFPNGKISLADLAESHHTGYSTSSSEGCLAPQVCGPLLLCEFDFLPGILF